MYRLKRKIPRKKKRCKAATEAYALILRKNMTKAEALFWKFLKKRQKTWLHTFDPQAVVHGYIPDFYCPSLFLAVEIDGRIHDRKNVKRNDRIRTRRLNKHGVTVIRFKNSDVFSGVQKLLDILEEVALD
mgnify:CR=1 FL=1